MKKILLILLAGVAVGMLLAPEKGSETWKKFSDGLDDLKDNAVDEMNNLVNKSKNLISKAKARAQTASEDW
jgi:gas vesicle protein